MGTQILGINCVAAALGPRHDFWNLPFTLAVSVALLVLVVAFVIPQVRHNRRLRRTRPRPAGQ